MRALPALFYGLCRFWEVNVREPSDVADFCLPGVMDLYVIIDDIEHIDRSSDVQKLRDARERVVVLDREALDRLRTRTDSVMFVQQLKLWCVQQRPRQCRRANG